MRLLPEHLFRELVSMGMATAGQAQCPGELLELMGNGHALLSLLSVKLTKDQFRWVLMEHGCPAAEGDAHGLIDWRTTRRANLHVADKAECWIPQRESSRNYHGSVWEQVCLETGLKSKQKSCTKGLLAARGQLDPLSSFSPLGVLWE